MVTAPSHQPAWSDGILYDSCNKYHTLFSFSKLPPDELPLSSAVPTWILVVVEYLRWTIFDVARVPRWFSELLLWLRFDRIHIGG